MICPHGVGVNDLSPDKQTSDRIFLKKLFRIANRLERAMVLADHLADLLIERESGKGLLDPFLFA